jgi:LmbE family N-acetylglucosaminyl deacetylase
MRLFNPRKYSGKNVLIVQAHCDDGDFHCGAAACAMSEHGANVIYVICTRGEKGTKDITLSPEVLTQTRRREQLHANELLGVAETIFFDFNDGELQPSFELQGRLTELIRRLRPAAMFMFDPDWPEHRVHPDHRASVVAALRADSFSGLPTYFPEHAAAGLEPYQCEDLFFFDTYRKVDCFLPVGKYFRRKFDAMLAHESQIEHMLTDEQKKIIRTLSSIPVDPVVQAASLAFTSSYIVETFRHLSAEALLR